MTTKHQFTVSPILLTLFDGFASDDINIRIGLFTYYSKCILPV